MTNNVFVLFNKLANRYGDVFCFASDGLALARVQPELKRAGTLDECELCRIGTIDIETGDLTPQSPIRIAWTVEPLPVTPPFASSDN